LALALHLSKYRCSKACQRPTEATSTAQTSKKTREHPMKRFFLLLSLFVCFVTPAFAQDDRARAEVALKTGVKQYKEGKYEEALTSYQEAAKFAPTAAGPYREMGKAYEILGREKEAISSYEEYLKRRPQATDAADIQGRLTALQAKQPVAEVKPVVEAKPVVEVKAEPATQSTPAATAADTTPLALAAPTKLERKFKVRPARVASLSVAALTVVGTSVFLAGGFNGLGGGADDAGKAGDVGGIEGVARSLQLSPKQAKTVQQLGTIALSIKF
jgi:tetratricopeptide (TPR) repeat protein